MRLFFLLLNLIFVSIYYSQVHDRYLISTLEGSISDNVKIASCNDVKTKPITGTLSSYNNMWKLCRDENNSNNVVSLEFDKGVQISERTIVLHYNFSAVDKFPQYLKITATHLGLYDDLRFGAIWDVRHSENEFKYYKTALCLVAGAGMGFVYAGPIGGVGGAIAGVGGSALFSLPDDFINDHYFTTVLSNEGHIVVESTPKYSNINTDFNFVNRKIVWTSNTEHRQLEDYELEELFEYHYDRDFNNYFSFEESNGDKPKIALIKDDFILINNLVYNVNEIYNYFDDNTYIPNHINGLNSIVNQDHYTKIGEKGTVDTYDVDGNLLEQIGHNCVNLELGNNRIELDGIADIKAYTQNNRELYKRSTNQTYCKFPDSDGPNKISFGEKLIQFNQEPSHENELNYLISIDKTKLTIKDGNTFKVYNNINGYYLYESPMQTFNLN